MSTEFYNTQWQMPNEANKSRSTNYSLQCNTGDKIEFPTASSILTGTNPYTVSFWYKWSSNLPGPLFYRGTWSSPGAAGNTLSITTQGTISTNYLRVYHHGSGNDYNITLSNMTNSVPDNQNKWLNVILANDGNGVERAYFNGVLSDITTLAAPVDLGNTYFHLNANQLGSGGGTCAYSDLVIFDYKLSDGGVSANETAKGDIALLYGDGTSVSNPMALSPAPKAYYKLSDSVWDGSEYITANNAAQDYVFDFIPNDSIDTNFTLPNYNSYSISVWYKKTGEPGQMPTGVDYYLWGNATSGGATKPRTSVRFNGDDKLRIITGDGTVFFQSPDLNVSTLLLDGKWHHILTTTVSGEIKLYIDGNLQATHTNSNIITGIVAETSYRLGQSGYNVGYLDESLLSNFQIFNTALSGPEVETLYNYGSPIRTLANIPQNSNLKAWYKLDATEIYNSSITDWEVNQASSFWKNSVDFNLTNSSANRAYIQCANTTNLNLTGAMTISAWMKGASVNNAGGQASGIGTTGGTNNRGYTLLRTTNNRASFGIASLPNSTHGVTSPTNSWKENEWNHVVGVFDPSSRFELYLNGEFVASASAPSQQRSNYSFQIGNRGDSNPSHHYNWLGQLSNVSIWNTALSNGSTSVGSVAGGEIATLYNSGEPLQDLLTGPQNSNLLSWWKLDNITTGIQDSKGTNNGTIVTTGNGLVSKFDQSVSTLNGESSGMSQSNLVQSDLQTVAPYSKYAMNFDSGSSDYIDLGSDSSLDIAGNDFSCSLWFNTTTTASNQALFALEAFSNKFVMTIEGGSAYKNVGFSFFWNTGPYPTYYFNGGNNLTDGNWHNYIITKQGTTVQAYIDGSAITFGTLNGSASSSNANRIARWYHGYYDGKISNISLWNKQLSSSEVREIYNEGLPSDLNTFSGTAPVAWWKLGEGVSYDGTSLIVQDYKGNNHGTSNSSMDQTDIVNGVGTSLNGASSGFSAPSSTVTNIVSDAPYSDKNAVSVNMQSAKSGSGIDTSTPQAT